MKPYHLHEVLVAPARPTAQPLRLLGGVLLIMAGFLVANIVYLQILRALPQWPAIGAELVTGSTARSVWIILFSFAPLLLVLSVVLRLLHHRSILSLVGPLHLVGSDFRRVLRATVPLFVLLAIIPTPEAYETQANMPLGQWLVLVPVSMSLIFIQISAEELLFRGYLQSQLAARFASPVVWMVLPSLLFGVLHYDPSTFGPNAAALAAWSALFGLAAADLTARAGNLGPALALHFVNNISAMMFSSMDGHWDGIALRVVPFGPEDVAAVQALLPVEVLFMLCCWLAARIALRR